MDIEAQFGLLRRVIDVVAPLMPPGTDEFTIELAYPNGSAEPTCRVRVLDTYGDLMPVSIPDSVHAMTAGSAPLFASALAPNAQRTSDGLPGIGVPVSFNRGQWCCNSFGSLHAPSQDAPRPLPKMPDREPWVPRSIDETKRSPGDPPTPTRAGQTRYFGALLGATSWETKRAGAIPLTRTRAGDVSVRTGRLAVWDSMYFPPWDWAIANVPPGRHAVWYISGRSGSHNLAIASVVAFARRRPVRWAVLEPRGFVAKGEGFAGIAVEAGTVGFMDLDGVAAFERAYTAGERSYKRLDRAIERLRLSDSPTCSLVPDAESGYELVMTNTGGDGGYPVFIGYDDTGAAACLLVDFFGLMHMDGEEDEDDE